MAAVNTGKYRAEKPAKKKFEPGASKADIPRENTIEGRIYQSIENVKTDALYGFHRVTDVKERTGFLINMHSADIVDDEKRLVSGVDFYFLEEDCSRFKVFMPFQPYFYILCKKEAYDEVSNYLTKKFIGLIAKIQPVLKEDLDLPNHLIGLKQKYLKLSFVNTIHMMRVKNTILAAVRANKERESGDKYYTDLAARVYNNANSNYENKSDSDQLENVIDIREYDVPHHVRVSIDLNICVGLWYSVKSQGVNDPKISRLKQETVKVPPEPIVLAYDIECTKLPLKFPDPNTDEIMMISYMIDGQGFLLTNRNIISSDIQDFEYTPKPEFKGFFKVYNDPDEKALLNRFFNHINEVKPHIIVTYNGDFFDWPYVESRAAILGIDMKERIGFSKEGDHYISRAATHMDAFHWVKRDSYLPMGSQGLKAVAKAKLRYDPVELDPEDMCRYAVEDPEILANYSVSDAVATFYLYQKYVHPFIFALCTIIPMEPDEVLRKGSGTLCESLLMVEAFRANIIYPNKQETPLTRMKNGHLLESETYVGGHVEALESGVFRADIPYRFKINRNTVDDLIDGIESAMQHAIVQEENIPMDSVLNFEEVCQEIKDKLEALKNHHLRLEKPVIYHLDVGAMYPNIILTNRLQPSAMVNEIVCAACDYNRINAKCKREMKWEWRGEVLKANLGEYQRVKQQLEIEKFPPKLPDGPRRAFYELSKQEQAAAIKARLSQYCKKTYNKVKDTIVETRTQTICQKENSFYVDTVRAFRDRRYEYKGMTKMAKKEVSEAIAKNDPAEIKIAKSKEVLYDSLQLAHKCILNSFYGYVMRKGSRWFSMEMGGVVCHTGANIIMKAREIIENVGRPLELDTDGIWCMLPASFPSNFIVKTTIPKKATVSISYPNAILNFMVKQHFTNNAYHELVDKEELKYEIRAENSIFFEVDGPYLAMVLPASKDEGKKLKKRYAVFHFDRTIAELKGFELKRRGELQLIKLFQSSVFDSFLNGNTLEECYASVAEIANHWLDILQSRGSNLSDNELFDLISENKSLARQLDDYGEQKSTSISTAKRLAEFLGDQMVKDKGLNCKYIISKKPEGAPVTERAIPMAIFQSEPSVTKHYLRKWLKDSTLEDFDIRSILDWSYYEERLGSCIQKIITIPAAMQSVPNPVPRVRHPDWLHKKLIEKDSAFKQRKMTEVFKTDRRVRAEVGATSSEIQDIEDTIGSGNSTFRLPISNYNKRKRSDFEEEEDEDQYKTWKEALGDPPRKGNSEEEFQAWLAFHKKKWAYQLKQKAPARKRKKQRKTTDQSVGLLQQVNLNVGRGNNPSTISGFFRQSARKLITKTWHIIQMTPTNMPGSFRSWILVDNELHLVRIEVPRIFYLNTRVERAESTSDNNWQKCVGKILPRSRPVYHLYKYTCKETQFQKYNQALLDDLNKPEVEGIYETQMSLEFRAILNLGCMCKVRSSKDSPHTDTFQLEDLEMKHGSYLTNENALKYIFLYQHWSSNHQRSVWGLFVTPTKKAYICIQDNVRTEKQIPNMNNLYSQEKQLAMEEQQRELDDYPEAMQFDVQVFTSVKQVFRTFQNALKAYKQEMKGATAIVLQSAMDKTTLANELTQLNDYPVINTNIQDLESLYTSLEWQKVGVTKMLRHYFTSNSIIKIMIEQSNFFHAPIGNVPSDSAIFGADLFYARLLQANSFVLWCSPTDKPDFGGSENDDNRLFTNFEESSSCTINNAGTYSSITVELDVDSLAITALLRSHHVHDIDGINSATSFFNKPQLSLHEMVSEGKNQLSLPCFDETALCYSAYKILKNTVTRWVQDVSQYRNLLADNLIVNFYRWLRNPQSLLYDPALCRTLNNDMKKLFVQLVAEFQRYGTVIVHGNYNKLILCTKKRSAQEAKECMQMIIEEIGGKELFHSINMTYNQCWDYLIWLDVANFAGIKGKLPKVDSEHEESQEKEPLTPDEEMSDDEEETSGVEMNWNLTEYLPVEGRCQEIFNTTIATFIIHVNNHLRENYPGNKTPRPQKQSKATLSQHRLTQQLGVGVQDDSAEFAKKLISGEISRKLFEIIGKIHKKIPSKTLSDVEFARMNLNYATKRKIVPALELVKAICKVLSLEKEIDDEVNRLKSNLLRLIGVGQFSADAEWKDPCISFVLPEITCQECSHIRDIDLCKDKFRTEHARKLHWKCSACESLYDNKEIEFMLIDILNRKMMAYVLQDIQCERCLEIQTENANERCHCSGTYRNTVPKINIAQFVKVVKYLAERCDMPILKDMLENPELGCS